ncbi:MAG: HupE/UreJ family protein [Ottowia sp.]|jgi:urease accessory protein|nr:HupE/UreJ family protein [Ottowia sp.]MBP7457099.1 HupE/UreJ family protein [Ottowia sp.]MBP8860217.1 HupE/UreJ family protein [Ottowia sp.]MBP8894933.1 HupE/UreJ family protein [Ottowia sp.]MBP9522531.1 HupE/UreJ family protein [Ottowia sp.]
MKNRAFILLGLLWPALPALAHTGALGDHVHPGFMAGLLHPFTGIDHLAAMLAVGVWSALAVRPVWVAPLAFVALLGAGALGGLAGVAVPGVEPMIAASLLVTGLLIATRAQWPVRAAALVAGLFAFFHGAAHGMELSGVGVAQALAGMLIGSAALHLTGIGLGRWVFDQRRWLSAMAGGAVALLGSALLLRMAW